MNHMAATDEIFFNRAGLDRQRLESLVDQALTGVHLDLAPVILDDGADFAPSAALLMALWDRRGVPGSAALGSFGADPIGALATVDGSPNRSMAPSPAWPTWPASPLTGTRR